MAWSNVVENYIMFFVKKEGPRVVAGPLQLPNDDHIKLGLPDFWSAPE